MSDARVDVAIIGAGISGLACAERLVAAGQSVAVIEKGTHAGGVIESTRDRGFLVEGGPNSTLDTKASLGELVDAAGVRENLVTASASARKRFVVRGGRLHALPMSPPAIVSTKLFSGGAKLRVFREPFIRPGVEDDESVLSFFRRRFGPEVADYAIDPFVSGVYAGDPDRLGIRSAFPTLARFEADAGSVIRGGIRAARERRRGGGRRGSGKMISFDEGMAVLTSALARRIGGALRTNTECMSLRRGEGAWEIAVRGPDGTGQLAADAVVVCAPADATADLIAPFDGEAAVALRAIEYAPVASVFLGFDRGAVDHPLDGFGFLVPSSERRNILGTIFSSSLFPGRAPEGSVALTVFLGGVRRPEIVAGSDDALIDLSTADLARLLGVRGSPTFVRIRRWMRAIPQYNRGHYTVVDRLRELESRLGSLFFATNYVGGISVADCVDNATICSESLLGKPVARV